MEKRKKVSIWPETLLVQQILVRFTQSILGVCPKCLACDTIKESHKLRRLKSDNLRYDLEKRSLL